MATTNIDDYLNVLPLEKLAGKQDFWSFYDSEADTLYFNFKKPSVATDSELTDDDVIIRYEGDQVVGFTVLHASKRGGSLPVQIVFAQQLKLLETYLLILRKMKFLPTLIWWRVNGINWMFWLGYPVFRPLLFLLITSHIRRILVPLERVYKLNASASPSEAVKIQWVALHERVKLMREEIGVVIVSPLMLTILGPFGSAGLAVIISWETIKSLMQEGIRENVQDITINLLSTYIFYVVNLISIALGLLSIVLVITFYVKRRLFNEPYVQLDELFLTPVLKKIVDPATGKSLYLEEQKLFKAVEEPYPNENPVDQLLLGFTYLYLCLITASGFGILAWFIYSRNHIVAYIYGFLCLIPILAGFLLIRGIWREIRERRAT
ncbi:DUF2283 domain-containing protein [Gloeobacter violaceus]|uniref:Glr0386 protein n=1 Tax=Gloeobacter violaceus (strain ATCC 29082 / PCC 7421) TaxID=251221 RepID=Q7NNM5_GLOVI|nr:DUF2283 domain-containing protein [Gloeobacter violaceus]BAC88327.1 glr0386 [Gloeobacter violaceus PCC 7421]